MKSCLVVLFLWEVTWQRKDEDMFGQVIQLPPKGWSDPLLKQILPEDVVERIDYQV